MSMKINEETKYLNRKAEAVHPAIIAVWAALIAVAHMLPTIPLVVTGGSFTVSAAFLPLAGIFFGPFAGALCAAIGGFIGNLIAPQSAWLGLGTFIIGTTNAFTAGLISRGKWLYGVAVIIFGVILWFSTAIGREALLYPGVVYTLGIITAILGGLLGKRWLAGKNRLLQLVAVWLIAFAGFIGAAGVGNYFGIVVKQTPVEIWNMLAFVSPTERAIFSLGSALIGVPLLAALPKIGIFIGSSNEEDV